MESLELTAHVPAAPAQVFEAWVHPERHAAMTGGAANGESHAGGGFTAWDGYISGQFLELSPGERILMSWRTAEFPEGAPHSRVEILLVPDGEGTRLTLRHTDIPDGQGDRYKDGWSHFYFEPMAAHFAAR